MFGTQQRLRTFPHITSINIAGSVVHLSDTVTTLGVNLDQTLNLHRHVNNLCKLSYYHLCALHHIRASLPDDICLSLGTALTQSRLDYSNSVLFGSGTAISNLHKLQLVLWLWLWLELSLAFLVQSPHLSSFPISTGSQPISK